MIHTIKSWFVKAVANGGGILVLMAVLLAGLGGAAVKEPVFDLIGGAPASPAVVNLNAWQCPDTTWEFNAGSDSNMGSAFQSCTKNKVLIRHFDRVPPGNNQEAYQDQGVYPFVDLDSMADAIRIANSR